MNQKNRFMIAAALALVLVLIAGGVWAAPRFQGTVPPIPVTGGSSNGEVIDMGTALIIPQCTDCTVNVNLVDNPGELAPAPEGKQFIGGAFQINIEGPEGSTIKIAFSLPPELANKNVKIYKLNTEANPPVWVEVPGAVIENGTISVNGGAGAYTLIADQ